MCTLDYELLLFFSGEMRKDEFCAELIQSLQRLSPDEPLYIASYGIGSLFESPVSQYQYALLLRLLKEVPDSRSGLYDPILTAAEFERAALDGVARLVFPLSTNTSVPLKGSRLFLYMPHCEAQTYAELLKDIGESTDCDRILLYGSDLLGYAGLAPADPYFDVQKHSLLSEFFVRQDVFNDCYLQSLKRRI
jgi:hypothetical protein